MFINFSDVSESKTSQHTLTLLIRRGVEFYPLNLTLNFERLQNLSMHLVSSLLFIFRCLRVKNKSALPYLSTYRGKWRVSRVWYPRMPDGIDKDQVVAVASLIQTPLQTSHLLIRDYPVVLSDNEFSLSPLF